MTVEIKGHVHAMELGRADYVRMHVQLEKNRCDDRLVVEVTPAEAKMYTAGTPVIVQIRPNVPR